MFLTVLPELVSAQDFSIGGRLGVVGGEVYFEDKETDDLNLTNLNREPLPRGWARLFSGALSVAYLVPLRGTRP
jgi:hypothetical protein